ncbi:mercuric reductase [Flavobacterium agrisoli]|uniref:Mercuric reductase n=1 Tax=Flavobacterium agrisoli TaxID=2793066 RepID=A0A934UIF5_9FLAO|nr:mercuric reductase [Flavobacterium agrisoli]MBK0368388.1 mercuric reductase [Flavobacterium agrisoli]
MKKFDYIIIGTGQAGTPLAFSLAETGTVAIIEKDFLGGTCVNNGCIPTKAYVASARKMWDAKNGVEFGVEITGKIKANLSEINARKQKLVLESRENIESAIEKNKKITLYKGEAHFSSNYEIKVGAEKLTAKKIFINVGARAVVPETYKEVPHYTNENILELTDLPKHLIIMGGSYIGLEFGQMFRRFGSEVTIIERSDRLIGREDENVSDSVAEILKAAGINIVFNAKEIHVKQEKKTILATMDNRKVSGSHLLLAIGRTPNSDTLHLENTDIKLDEKNYIKVDSYCQTNVEGIFALGDCNGEGAFTHTSYNDFQIVESFLLKKKEKKISDRIMTYGLFIDPPLGRIGMTKKEALEKGYEVLVAHRPMTKVGRAKEKGETLGFMEALIDAKTKLFLGACVLGVGGDEIIGSITNLMYAKQPYTVYRDAVHIHPTVSELIPTMLEDLKPIKK